MKRVENLLFLASSVFAVIGLLLAAKRRVHGVFLFATLLGFYPLTYYLTFASARYRHPIEPEMVILGVFSIASLFALLHPHRQPRMKFTLSEAEAIAASLKR